MPITGTNPVVIPAQTYTNYWILDLHIRGMNPNVPVQVTVLLQPYSVATNGTITLAPVPPVLYKLNDLLGAAAADPALAQVVGALEAKLQSMAQQAHLI